MKVVALVALVGGFACSTPRNDAPGDAVVGDATPSDAGLVDTAVIDAPADGAPDAPVPTCPPASADADGDCVADATDVCPTIPDPAQIDLDGDGIGWMCDPFETVAIPGAPTTAQVRASIAGNTFAALVAWQTSQYSAIAVSPQGKLVIAAGSANAAHAWTQGLFVGEPLVDPEEHIWWPIRPTSAPGETGLVDPVAGTYAKKRDGMFSGSDVYFVQGRLGLIELRGSPSVPALGLYTPKNGALVTMDAPLLELTRPSSSLSPPTLIYAVAGTTPGKFALRRYILGDPTATTVVAGATVLDNLDEVSGYAEGHVDFSGEISEALHEAPYCIRQGQSVRYVGVTGASVSTGALPFGGLGEPLCPTQSSRVEGNTLFLGSDAADDSLTDNIVSVHDGIVTLTLAHVHDARQFNYYGTQIPVVSGRMQDGSNPTQYAIAPDRSTVTLASDLLNVEISTTDDVVHIAGIAPDATGQTGDLVVVRYRPSTGVQRTVLRTGVARNANLFVQSGAEGAAFITLPSASTSWLVPSTATTATRLPFTIDRSAVITRGTRTLVAVPSPAPAFGYVLDAYDEPSGAPRFTPLTDAGHGLPTVLGPEWFSITKTNSCRIARITTMADGTPTLAPTTDCQEPFFNNGVRFQGFTASGVGVATSENALYLLSPTGVTRVVHDFDEDTFRIVYDSRVATAPIVGWVGQDPLGGFACLASHPERCWSVPNKAADYVFGESTSSPDGSLMVATLSTNFATPILTIVRSLGAGNRPPPLF